MSARTAACLAATVILGVAGCSIGQKAPAAAPVTPSAPTAGVSASAGRLLAFLVPGASQTATVEWVTPTGRVTAKAGFTVPRLTPWGNAGTLMQPYAHLAAGSIYYLDAQGAVRRLGADGSTSIATNLLLRSGQNVVSFAVSPDGRKIAATVLNYPPQHNPPPTSLGDPFLEPGDWWYDYETATAGQPATRVVSRDLGSFYPNLGVPSHITTVFGWDRGGPVGILDTLLAAQQPPFSALTPGKALIHLGSGGSHLDQLGGSGCIPLDSNSAGNVVCYYSSSPKTVDGCITQYVVTSPAGTRLWSASWTGCVYNPRLSPASDRFCTDSGAVYSENAPLVRLPSSLSSAPDACQGWLDDSVAVLTGAAANGALHVYTLDVVTGKRTSLMPASSGVKYLGSVPSR